MNKRRAEVYSRIPSFKELDDKIASYSLQQIKNRIYGNEAKTDESYDIDKITQTKKRLLIEAGFEPDYLDTFYDCSECKDSGFIDGKKCKCFKKKESALLFEQSNLSEILKENNFSVLSYDYYKGEQLERFKKAVADCHLFIDNFDNEYKNILFQGNVGTGKSFLSACIAYELLKKDYQVVYFSAANMFKILSDAMFDKNINLENMAFNDLIYSSDLLIIDDLGTEVTNSATVSQLFSVINERHLKAKSTIISTNLEINQIQDRYTDRIFSRFLERYSFKKIDGPDIRKIKNSL